MDEIKFNVRSLSNPNLVRRKNNDLDSKQKEKAYEKDGSENKKHKNPTSGEVPESNDSDTSDNGTDKTTHVDVFI